MSKVSKKQIALITGVSRIEGLGFETARQLASSGFHVIITSRNSADSEKLANVLVSEGLEVSAMALDVSKSESINAAAAYIRKTYGKLDVLVNNAAGAFDYQQPVFGVTEAEATASLAANLVGPWMMINAFADLLRAAPQARVVNVSSEAASFNAPYGILTRGVTLGTYTVSKAGLNALTMKMALAFEKTNVKINAICPGWIATYPGTAEMGARPVALGAASVLWGCLLGADGPSGGFFRDGAALPW